VAEKGLNMTGYIFDHRKELESDVWLLPPMYHRVWQWIKYKVNHSEAKIPNKDGTFTVIKAGQHATSLRHIAKGVGYYEGLKWKEPNPKTIKTILDWLEKQGMLTVEGNTLGTVLTVANWELYQKEVVKGNSDWITNKHLLDTNKKNKEELKNEKTNYMVIFEHYNSLDLVKHRMLTEDMKKSIDKAKSELHCDDDKLIELLNRHNQEVKSTSYSNYPVKKRTLSEFFGQKVFGGTALICAKYDTDDFETKKPMTLNMDDNEQVNYMLRGGS
jgi:hypothetical protein